METKVNYTVVGLFVIVLGTVFIILFFWLSTFRQEKVYHTYMVYTQEDVTGLNIDSPVRYNGVPVGLVRSIQLDPRNLRLVRIELEIKDGTPIPPSTFATRQLQGIRGLLYLGLKTKKTNAPPLKP